MNKITFIDLFAGIGGMRIPFENLGCKCVFSSEWDKYSQITYSKNFGETPKGDITKIDSNRIPSHNILLAGFPCQPFSISGISKKKSMGLPHGFNDPTQGTLFFEIKRILREKKPDAFLLENVKNLKTHDRGNTFNIILNSLVNDLKYYVHYKIIDAVNYVPQHRERIFIVGFKEKRKFEFPIYSPPTRPKIKDILLKETDDKYTLSDKLWNYLQDYATKHRKKGNGFGYGLVNLNSYARTMSARYYKDGSEILIPQKNKNPRRLTPKECARLMGFPKNFVIPVSDTQAYRQFGNSVVVPVVEDLAKAIIGAITNNNYKFTNSKYYKFIRGDTYGKNLFNMHERISF